MSHKTFFICKGVGRWGELEIQREIKPLNAIFSYQETSSWTLMAMMYLLYLLMSFYIFFVETSVLCKKEVVSSHWFQKSLIWVRVNILFLLLIWLLSPILFPECKDLHWLCSVAINDVWLTVLGKNNDPENREMWKVRNYP